MQGELFGDEELLLKQKSRSCTIMCHSNYGQLRMIKTKDFEDLVLAKPGARQFLLERLKANDIILQGKCDQMLKQFFKYRKYLF